MIEAVNICALVSIGRHPLTGRARRANLDARAVELGLQLHEGHNGFVFNLVHAGAPEERVLKDYIGMGLPQIDVINVEPQDDIIPALAIYLKERNPKIILTGDAAEDNFGSGLTPFLIAKALDRPIVSNICEIAPESNRIIVTQALERGGRRRIGVQGACVLSVGHAAPAARQSAFSKGRKGEIVTLPNKAPQVDRPDYTLLDAKPKQKRLFSVDPNASAADRLKAVSEMTSGNGEVIANLSPAEIAKRLKAEFKSII